MQIGLNLSLTGQFLASTAYSANGFNPALVADFIDESYQGESANSLTTLIDHNSATAGNATMVDSTGYIKWRPHNLLTYSEDFTASDWTKVNATVTANAVAAPDSTTTADLITYTTTVDARVIAQETISAGDYTFSVWLKGTAGETITVEFDSTSDQVTLTSDWVLYTVTQNVGSGVRTVRIIRRAGDTALNVYAWGAHLYRSDLGGMADVPAAERVLPDATTYVRTAGRETTGVELVPQDFSSWLTDEPANTSVTESGGTVTIALTATGGYPRASAPITTEIGKHYNISVSFSNNTTGFWAKVHTAANLSGTAIVSNDTESSGTHYLSFTATATTHYINIFAEQANTGSFDFDISSINVKEIDVDPSTARYLPRIGHHVYNGSQWVNEGLLHESEARTNLVTYSEDFTNSAWFALNTATLAIDATGPDGQTSAVTLVDSGATGSNAVSVTETFTVATSSDYTFSVFAKADQLNWMSLQLRNFTTPTDGQTFFNLSDGTAGTAHTGHTPLVEDYGNGWYRCSVTFTTDATDTSGAIDIRVADGDNDASVDLDGTSSILIYGAQLEQASTPSSYIPTSGSTVTRAAETLTIEHENLPWPSPYVISDELVTNGTFDSDTSGWTGSNATLSVVSNELQVSVTANGTAYASQAITTVAGRVYTVTVDFTDDAVSGNTFLYAGPAAGNGSLLNINMGSITGTYTGTFVASGGTTYISASSATAALAGETFRVDNISVKEINPLAVSIAMDGRMTYADTDSGAEVYFYRYPAGGSPYIDARVDASGANTGRVTFRQYDGSTSTQVASSSDTYLPNVAVPFNVCSRFGSNFCNGAVDGVLLTESTSPTELPDVEAYDLNLGHLFMGTIGTFRIWSNDIGDDGLVEATEPSDEPSLSMSFDGTESSFVDFEWSE